MSDSGRAERAFHVKGRVQGVGFRWWAVERAREAGLTGWVRNRRDGSVEVHAAGATPAVEDFAARLKEGPPAARVSEVEEVPAEGPGREEDFRIRG